MNPQMNPRANLGCASVLVVIGCGLTYLFTGSLNPLQVYSTGGTGAIVTISLIGFFALSSFFAYLSATIAGPNPDPVKALKMSLVYVLCMIVIMLIVTYQSTNTWNPLHVFQSGSTIARVGVVFIGVPIVFGVVMIIGYGASRMALLPVIATLPPGVKVGDLRCPSRASCDGKPLVKFIPVYGNPVYCSKCERWWHQKCLQAEGGLSHYGCPGEGCGSDVRNESWTPFQG